MIKREIVYFEENPELDPYKKILEEVAHYAGTEIVSNDTLVSYISDEDDMYPLNWNQMAQIDELRELMSVRGVTAIALTFPR